jgi:hypothetical protein
MHGNLDRCKQHTLASPPLPFFRPWKFNKITARMSTLSAQENRILASR